LVGWIKETKKGGKYLSIVARPDEQAQQERTPTHPVLAGTVIDERQGHSLANRFPRDEGGQG
jgi:hypothetical protein